MSITTALIISSITAVVAAPSLLLEIKFWPGMKSKEKKDNKFKSKHLKKILQHKTCKYFSKTDYTDGSNRETRLNKYTFIETNLSEREHQIWSFGI